MTKKIRVPCKVYSSTAHFQHTHYSLKNERKCAKHMLSGIRARIGEYKRRIRYLEETAYMLEDGTTYAAVSRKTGWCKETVKRQSALSIHISLLYAKRTKITTLEEIYKPYGFLGVLNVTVTEARDRPQFWVYLLWKAREEKKKELVDLIRQRKYYKSIWLDMKRDIM